MPDPKRCSCQRPPLLAFALVAALILPACADAIYYTPLQPSPRTVAPQPVEHVEVLATPPVRPYTNLGLLQVVESIFGKGVGAMVAGLRQRAADLGCDALLITSIDHQESRYHAPSIQGGCLVYNEPTRPLPVHPRPP